MSDDERLQRPPLATRVRFPMLAAIADANGNDLEQDAHAALAELDELWDALELRAKEQSP